MKKYLFLDFDGVLNTNRHRFYLIKEGKNTKDQFATIFDPDTIYNLKTIIEHAGAEIVISSSWKEFGQYFILELWVKRNMPGKVYSIIPSLILTNYLDNNTGESISIPETYSKGLEINAWLETYATGNYRYCIIDDENYFLPYQLEHFVQVNEDKGLTSDIASIIIDKLNRK